MNEFRGLWVDAFNSGFKTSTQVSQLLADARTGNFNAVIVQMRRRGDAFYNSSFEPKNAEVSPSGFDPLADLIAKAHDISGGKQRIEVHAWIVSFPIWNSTNTAPASANHPFNLHPDWLTQEGGGNRWDGGNFLFDPGHGLEVVANARPSPSAARRTGRCGAMPRASSERWTCLRGATC